MARLRAPAGAARAIEVLLTVDFTNVDPAAAQRIVARLERQKGHRTTESKDNVVSLRYEHKQGRAVSLAQTASQLLVAAKALPHATAIDVWACDIVLKTDPGDNKLGQLISLIQYYEFVLFAYSDASGTKVTVEFKGEPGTAMVQLVRGQLAPYTA